MQAKECVQMILDKEFLNLIKKMSMIKDNKLYNVLEKKNKKIANQIDSY